MCNLPGIQDYIRKSFPKRARCDRPIRRIPDLLAIPFGTISFEADDGGWHPVPLPPPSSQARVTDQVTRLLTPQGFGTRMVLIMALPLATYSSDNG
jgi:hypothetical protein